MKKQNPALLYGLIGAAILILISIGMQMYMISYMKKTVESSGTFSPMKFLGFTIIILLVIITVFIICIIKAIKDYRKINPEYTYRKLVGQGLQTTLIIALVSTAFSFLYSQFIDPESRQKSIDLTLQLYENMNLPEEQKEKMIEQIQNQNPVRQTITSLALTLFFGLIVSLISASVLNKRNKSLSSNPNNLS